jgi:hypothetical protein
VRSPKPSAPAAARAHRNDPRSGRPSGARRMSEQGDKDMASPQAARRASRKKLLIPKVERCECCRGKAIAIGAVTAFVPLKKTKLAVTVEIRKAGLSNIPTLCQYCFMDMALLGVRRMRGGQ